ncbi:uncharacterized protein LOC135391301 isoform X2 [Ornithodoros turicata]|uniref:uncharacterized protein LOC135391301 isoform X2 n=1 Tax=Ornithodoros turicata TaxID=34597 RepID=UPI0031398700
MFDFARQGYSYSQTPDEAKVGSSYITSGYPDEARSVHAVRVCSSHFTDNVYLDENIMQVQLRLTQKRKLDAVPTVFHEQSEPATSTLQAARQGQAQVKDQVLLIQVPSIHETASDDDLPERCFLHPSSRSKGNDFMASANI